MLITTSALVLCLGFIAHREVTMLVSDVSCYLVFIEITGHMYTHAYTVTHTCVAKSLATHIIMAPTRHQQQRRAHGDHAHQQR
jgi:hypothetical protein